MRIQYKQILAFVVIILFSFLPMSLFILHKQEQEKINMLVRRGLTDSRILARSALNVLLLNGGDIPSSRLDAKETIRIVASLRQDGLVYADMVLLSSREKYNGLILASFPEGSNEARKLYPDGRVPGEELKKLPQGEQFHERYIEAFGDDCFEFSAPGLIPGEKTICAARLIYSEKKALSSIHKLRNLIIMVLAAGIFLVTLLGYVFSRIITRPVDDLIDGIEVLGGGDLNYRIPVRGNDEFGRLAMTFNHFAYIVTLQIGELQKTNRELRRLDELKDYFIANISHELRTPLFGIIGLTQSLMEKPGYHDDPDGHRDLTLIEVSAWRLSNMINNILDFSQLKHGDVAVSMKSLDVAQIIQLVVSILIPLAVKKGLAVTNEISFSEYVVKGDAEKLQQIFFNLVGNAIKFTSSGEIVISASRERDDKGREKIRVSVADTGIGIPEEKLEGVFESFEQVQADKRSNVPGSGLGLSITRDLVELHGGTIAVISREGEGSTFSFTLDPGEGKTDASAESLETALSELQAGFNYLPGTDLLLEEDTAEETEKSGEGFSVMIVDDEPVLLQVLRNSLELAGFYILTFTSGEEALQQIQEGMRPDMILLDVMLPGISGYDVCRQVREKYTSYDLPILMLTAKNRPGDVLTGFEAGANDYITKPIERKELLARVNSMISFKSAAKLTTELDILNHDIALAHEIQESVLISTVPEMDGLKAAVHYEPMMKLGGDFYDVRQLDDHRIAVLLADVSGHGVPAAFICAMLKVTYSFRLEKDTRPDVMLKNLNESMYNFTGDQYVTAIFAIIDLEKMTMTHGSGGHWPPMIMRRDKKTVDRPFIRGVPFGWMETADYRTMETSFGEGDRIFFYTDGIVEPRNEKGEMFMTADVDTIICEGGDLDHNEFSDYLISRVREWTGMKEEDTFDDDVTLIVVDIG